MIAALKDKGQLSACSGNLYTKTVVSTVRLPGKVHALVAVLTQAHRLNTANIKHFIQCLQHFMECKPSQVNSPKFNGYISVDLYMWNFPYLYSKNQSIILQFHPIIR